MYVYLYIHVYKTTEELFFYFQFQCSQAIYSYVIIVPHPVQESEILFC